MTETRVYAVIHSPVPLTEEQWQTYFQAAVTDGLGYLVNDAANHAGNMPHNVVNFGPISLAGDKVIVDFEFVPALDANGHDGAYRANVAVMQSTGGLGGRDGLQAVMDAEAKQRLQSASASLLIIGYGARDVSIAEARAWLDDHSAEWFASE
jgi:hypothetical protein